MGPVQMRMDSTVGDRLGQALPLTRTEQKDVSTFAPAATASTTASAMEVALRETGGWAGFQMTKTCACAEVNVPWWHL